MTTDLPLRFHWSLSQAGEKYRRASATTMMSGLPPFEAQLALCRRAEESGIDSMLMAIGFARPDPLVLSAALGMGTESIKFMVACRAGLTTPTLFVQQVNTLSAAIGGRVHINMVAGHTPDELGYYGDFLDHDARFERIDEFLHVCRALWQSDASIDFDGAFYKIQGARLNTQFDSATGHAPELFLGGSSPIAGRLAARHGACLWRLAQEPSLFREEMSEAQRGGAEVGVLTSIIARPTRKEALRAAEDLIAPLGEESREVHRRFAAASDSIGFRSTYETAETTNTSLAGCLWAGAVPYLGAPAIALVGSAEEVAAAFLEYKRIGVSQFLLMGWPDFEEMTFFGREVLPLVRYMEAGVEAVVGGAQS